MERTLISRLTPGQTARIQGFAENVRVRKTMIFLVVADRSGRVQVTVDRAAQPEAAEAAALLTVGSSVTVEGLVQENAFVKLGGIELLPERIRIDSLAAPLPLTADGRIVLRLHGAQNSLSRLCLHKLRRIDCAGHRGNGNAAKTRNFSYIDMNHPFAGKLLRIVYHKKRTEQTNPAAAAQQIKKRNNEKFLLTQMKQEPVIITETFLISYSNFNMCPAESTRTNI